VIPVNGRPIISLALEVVAGSIVGLAVLLHLDVSLRGSLTTMLQRTLKVRLVPSEAE
jgi:hypothetical protein